MKYIKPFNENTVYFVKELRDFCEMNLAYLIDDGAEIAIVDNVYAGVAPYLPTSYILEIRFQRKLWTEIKDHFIPFATRLNNKYQIEHNKINNSRIYYSKPDNLELYKWEDIKIENIINDQLNLDQCKFIYISIFITGYKQISQTKKSFLTKIKSYFK